MKSFLTTAENGFYFHRARSDTSGEGDSEDEGEWVAAGELRAGDLARRSSGEWVRITSVTPRPGRVRVYNFEVSVNHNYFVGDGLAHLL